MQLPLRGIVTPLATPLAQSKQAEPVLDAQALDGLIDHVITGGVHGIFLLGTTGESSSLSREMRQEIVHRACAKVQVRVPVLVSISDNAISESLRMAETAVEAGADALVLAAPCYFQNSQDDLFRYVREIAARVTLPLFLYNIPHLTKNSFEPETVRLASELPGVVGLKDSTGDLGYLERTVELLRSRRTRRNWCAATAATASHPIPSPMRSRCVKRARRSGNAGTPKIWKRASPEDAALRRRFCGRTGTRWPPSASPCRCFAFTAKPNGRRFLSLIHISE